MGEHGDRLADAVEQRGARGLRGRLLLRDIAQHLQGRGRKVVKERVAYGADARPLRVEFRLRPGPVLPAGRK